MIQAKRDSLVKFIRQQMEGPGACNGHFYCLGDKENGRENEEVINTTPGSLYSTAVLFPQRRFIDKTVSQEKIQNQGIDPDLEIDSSYQESQDDNSSEELDERVNRLGTDEEDLYSLSQRFPNTIGISCCLDKKGKPITSSDLVITISGRYYKKLSKEDYCNVVVKIDDEPGFSSFFDSYKSHLGMYVSVINGGIHLAKDITNEIGTVKETLLTINKELCRKVAILPDNSLDAEYEQIGENYRYLKSYKERLWRKLKYFKDTYLSDEERQAVDKRITEVERYETYLSYLEDAMNICNTKSFGFWQSRTFNKTKEVFVWPQGHMKNLLYGWRV